MIRLVVDNGPDPVEAAWEEFDAKAIELQAMYAEPSVASPQARRELAMDTVKAWMRFRDIYAAMPPVEPGPKPEGLA